MPASMAAAVPAQPYCHPYRFSAGSLFDERLAPAFLKAQQQQLLLLQRGQQNSELPQPTQQQEQAAEAAPPAKRRRHASGSLAACKPAAAAAAAAAVAAQGQHHPINGEEGGSEEREGAEEEAALAAHLKELGPGFGRDDLLAGWLRQLLLSLRPTSAGGGADIDDGGACSDAATAAQPGAGAAPQQQEQQQQQAQRAQRAERVWELAERWSEVAAWRPRLAAACRAVGLPPPAHRHEWLPLATGWCVTFEVRVQEGVSSECGHVSMPGTASIPEMRSQRCGLATGVVSAGPRVRCPACPPAPFLCHSLHRWLHCRCQQPTAWPLPSPCFF